MFTRLELAVGPDQVAAISIATASAGAGGEQKAAGANANADTATLAAVSAVLIRGVLGGLAVQAAFGAELGVAAFNLADTSVASKKQKTTSFNCSYLGVLQLSSLGFSEFSITIIQPLFFASSNKP